MTVVPLQNNVRQIVPLQKQEPSEPIKPMFTPEEAKALSAASQAQLNNADWIAKYREMSKSVTPRVDPISMQSQMAAALRDPVYGQATAAGLAAGEGMLNSWIAGINSRARRDENNLANERWIKAMDDLAKERELRQAELDEAKKRYLPGESEVEDPFLSPEDQKVLDAMNKKIARGQVFNNQVAYEQGLDAQRRAVENRQKFLDSRKRSLNITGEALDAAGATKGMTKEQAMDKYGTQYAQSSFLPKWLGGTDALEDRVSKLLYDTYKDSRFNVMTPLQFINRFEAINNKKGADKLRAVIGSLVKDGYRIDKVIGGIRPDDPVYFKIGSELKLLEPRTMTLEDVTLR